MHWCVPVARSFFDFIDPDIDPDETENIPDRCPLCDEEESIGRPAYCYVHRCIWNDTMNECPDCEDYRMMYNCDYGSSELILYNDIR